MVARQSQGHRRGPGLRAGVVLDHGVVRAGPDPPVDRLTLGPDRLDDYVQRLRQRLSGQLSWYVGDLYTAEAAVTFQNGDLVS
ncbi:hypothetical protein [Nonomuraea sp. NPDC003709]|uniref:hypothetical protein n=1 Tax=Nonomuraea sp. NPDC003709 TaxID=3154450 RepID=UPI0033B6D0B9